MDIKDALDHILLATFTAIIAIMDIEYDEPLLRMLVIVLVAVFIKRLTEDRSYNMRNLILISALVFILTACNGDGDPNTALVEYDVVRLLNVEGKTVEITYESSQVYSSTEPFDYYFEVMAEGSYTVTLQVYGGKGWERTIDIERQDDYAIINGERFEQSLWAGYGWVVEYDLSN